MPDDEDDGARFDVDCCPHLRDVSLRHLINHRAAQTFDRINEMENRLMALVSIEQTDLDAFAAAFNDLASTLTADDAGISAEIADLLAKVNAGTQLTAADLSGLQAAQSSVTAAVAAASALLPASAPAASTPPDQTPAATDTAPVDIPAPVAAPPEGGVVDDTSTPTA